MKEQLLSDYDKTSISSENLQNELNRIVRDTKNATRLNQYFSLFDNNANSIVECLVRPIVVKNLWRKNTNVTKTYRDQKNLLVVPETTEFDYIIPKFHNDKELLTKNTLSQESDIWLTMNSADAPQARYFHTAVWTGTKMIVWGGLDSLSNELQSGGLYDPVFDSWESTAITGSTPSARLGHTAIWTGTYMVIWGGHDGTDVVNNGGRYDPSVNSWSDAGTSNLTARQLHSAVWTGSEMIVWGGFSYFDTGGRYVVDGNWTATGSNNAPSGRDRHTGVWAGDSMIIWGGDTIMGRTNTGAIYFPDELIFANGFE